MDITPDGDTSKWFVASALQTYIQEQSSTPIEMYVGEGRLQCFVVL
jgi:hypothetical protein